MINNNPINWKPSLKKSLFEGLEITPARTDGIIYKRFQQNKTGKFTAIELDYLVANQIPY